jgi:hypothetical protein
MIDCAGRFSNVFRDARVSQLAADIAAFAPVPSITPVKEDPPKADRTEEDVLHYKQVVDGEKRKNEKIEHQAQGLYQHLASSKITISSLQEQGSASDRNIKELEERLAKMDEDAKKLPSLEKQIQQKDSQIEKLREMVLCPICVDRYKDTSLVPCNHALCTKCANTIEKKNEGRCPICRIEVEGRTDLFVKLAYFAGTAAAKELRRPGSQAKDAITLGLAVVGQLLIPDRPPTADSTRGFGFQFGFQF